MYANQNLKMQIIKLKIKKKKQDEKLSSNDIYLLTISTWGGNRDQSYFWS